MFKISSSSTSSGISAASSATARLGCSPRSYLPGTSHVRVCGKGGGGALPLQRTARIQNLFFRLMSSGRNGGGERQEGRREISLQGRASAGRQA